MAERFDIEQRWPELFAQLNATQRRAVVQVLATAWHEGWTPNREDVENLTDEARGAIDRAEYLRRVDAAHGRKKWKSLKTEQFDDRFDQGEVITTNLDLDKARRPAREQRRVNVDFPTSNGQDDEPA